MTHNSSNDAPRQVPFYEQVANVLRTRITGTDTLQPTRLPTERELCEIHDVSRITISKALDLLEQEGLVERTPGRGTLTVPDAIRRWKRLRQSRVIHVLTGYENLEAIPNSYYGLIYQGLFARAEQAGYRLSTRQVYKHRTLVAQNPYLPDFDSCLGVIFVGLMNEPTIRLYTEAGYPVVCLDFWTADPLADGIVVDCYAEAQQAVEFLLSQGHRDLFYIGNTLAYTPPFEHESDALLMQAGLQRGLDLAGLPMLEPERIRFIKPLQTEAQKTVDWLLSLQPRPTAGLIFHNEMCRDILACLTARGIRCPEDISVITKSWEGDPTRATALRCPARLLGELAVDALLDRAAGRRTTALRIAVPSRLDRGRTVRTLPLTPAPEPLKRRS